jgi:hypothetical protein
MEICPRCKKRCLDLSSYGESAIYRSRHRLCVPCFHDEDAEIERKGTNDLPARLQAYGPENDYERD